MLTKNDTGLIIIDIQGKLAEVVHESETLISNATKLVKSVKTLSLPVVWLEQNPDRVGATVDCISELLVDQLPIHKLAFSACKEPEFLEQIKTAKVTNWLICGTEAHICVYQTAIELKKLGYKIEVVTDCISSRTIANKELAISKVMSNGIGVTSLEMCLYELMQDCKAKEFKKILKLIK